MKNIILVFVVLIGLANTTIAQSTKAVVERFANALQHEQYTEAYACFGDTIKRGLPEDQLETIWGFIAKGCNGLSGFEVTDATLKGGFAVHVMEASCSSGGLRLNVSVDTTQQKIVGFFMMPRKSEGIVPAYAKLEKFTERKLTFGLKTYPLQGTLTVPTGIVNPPVVVLVHGSGPNDRDESMEGNKVFRDIAWGLASMGIAVFRFDKRTYVYGKELAAAQRQGKPFDVDDEVTQDAVMAVQLMKANKLVDGKNVFVLGHSLGGMMAPRIVQKTKARGMILMAAPARKLNVLLEEQYRYLTQGKLRNAGDSAQLEEMIITIRKSGDTKQASSLHPDSLALGLSFEYWKSINAFNQVQVAQKMKQPILVLSGGRDYQVPPTDAAIWKQSLPPTTTCIEYPQANHLMMDGQGKPGPDEYQKVSNVNQQVVVDIATWIKSIAIPTVATKK